MAIANVESIERHESMVPTRNLERERKREKKGKGKAAATTTTTAITTTTATRMIRRRTRKRTQSWRENVMVSSTGMTRRWLLVMPGPIYPRCTPAMSVLISNMSSNGQYLIISSLLKRGSGREGRKEGGRQEAGGRRQEAEEEDKEGSKKNQK